MAVPKRKQSRSRRDKRSANKGLDPQPVNLCFQGSCQGTPRLPHQVCPSCGFYRGVKVLKTKAERTLVRTEKRKEAEARQPKQENAPVERGE